MVILMFKKVFIEEEQLENIYTKRILEKIKYDEIIHIKKIEDVWGKVKKPYLQKRTNLNLFLGSKEGERVKRSWIYGNGGYIRGGYR